MRRVSRFWSGLFLCALVASGLGLRTLRAARPQSAATTAIAILAGFADIPRNSMHCQATDDRAGLGGWRRGALCLARDDYGTAMARRDAGSRWSTASRRWDHLRPPTVAILVDSVTSAFQARHIQSILCQNGTPLSHPPAVILHGAWQGPGFQVVFSEYGPANSRTLQIEVTSSQFSVCLPVHKGAA